MQQNVREQLLAYFQLDKQVVSALGGEMQFDDGNSALDFLSQYGANPLGVAHRAAYQRPRQHLFDRWNAVGLGERAHFAPHQLEPGWAFGQLRIDREVLLAADIDGDHLASADFLHHIYRQVVHNCAVGVHSALIEYGNPDARQGQRAAHLACRSTS